MVLETKMSNSIRTQSVVTHWSELPPERLLHPHEPRSPDAVLNAKKETLNDPIQAIVPRNLRHHVQIERFKYFASVINANLHRWYEGGTEPPSAQLMNIPDYTHGHYNLHPPYGLPPESHIWQKLQKFYRGNAAWKPGFIFATRMALEGRVGDFCGTSFQTNPFKSSSSRDGNSTISYEHQLTKDELFHYLQLGDIPDDMSPVEEREERPQTTRGQNPNIDTVENTSSEDEHDLESDPVYIEWSKELKAYQNWLRNRRRLLCSEVDDVPGEPQSDVQPYEDEREGDWESSMSSESEDNQNDLQDTRFDYRYMNSGAPAPNEELLPLVIEENENTEANEIQSIVEARPKEIPPKVQKFTPPSSPIPGLRRFDTTTDVWGPLTLPAVKDLIMKLKPGSRDAYARISDMQAHLSWQQWYLQELAARGYLNPVSLKAWEVDLSMLANFHAWNYAYSELEQYKKVVKGLGEYLLNIFRRNTVPIIFEREQLRIKLSCCNMVCNMCIEREHYFVYSA
ncbi:hypothetical protein K440DRAFT_639003 [Wilcoxina mikolae CBS 423.85]|nr:hypothetical protein K440DRAFT_639003 [Wilcoxina mikolae CBS 423.85]